MSRPSQSRLLWSRASRAARLWVGNAVPVAQVGAEHRPHLLVRAGGLGGIWGKLGWARRPWPSHTGQFSAASSHTVTTRSNGTPRNSSALFDRPVCAMPISCKARIAAGCRRAGGRVPALIASHAAPRRASRWLRPSASAPSCRSQEQDPTFIGHLQLGRAHQFPHRCGRIARQLLAKLCQQVQPSISRGSSGIRSTGTGNRAAISARYFCCMAQRARLKGVVQAAAGSTWLATTSPGAMPMVFSSSLARYASMIGVELGIHHVGEGALSGVLHHGDHPAEPRLGDVVGGHRCPPRRRP